MWWVAQIPIYIFKNTFSVLDILQDIAEYIRLWSILLTYLITPWEYDEEKPTSYIGYTFCLSCSTDPTTNSEIIVVSIPLTWFLVVFGDEARKILHNSLFIFCLVWPVLPCKRKTLYRKSCKNQKRSYHDM